MNALVSNLIIDQINNIVKIVALLMIINTLIKKTCKCYCVFPILNVKSLLRYYLHTD